MNGLTVRIGAEPEDLQAGMVTAGVFSARRATKVDPMLALRNE